MDINDVVIHVNESLGQDARHGFEDRIRTVEGVIAPRFNDHTPHLMIVAYNTDRTNAHALLDAVQDSGYSG
jgi:hypothetical protein